MHAGRLRGVNGVFSFRFSDPKHRAQYVLNEDGDSQDEDSPRPRKRNAPAGFKLDGSGAGAGAGAGADAALTSAPRKRQVVRQGSAAPNGRKQVTQYDLRTGQILNTFGSGSQAAQVLGLRQSNVSQCCRGMSEEAVLWMWLWMWPCCVVSCRAVPCRAALACFAASSVVFAGWYHDRYHVSCYVALYRCWSCADIWHWLWCHARGSW